MKRDGIYALDFHGPALVGRQLTYLHGQQFVGRWVALCFLPYAGCLSVAEIDRHAARFQQVGARLLIVSSGARPLHRLWIDQPEKPWTTVLADPSSRLHRVFGVAVVESSPQCRTFVIDGRGILRLRVSHDFVDSDLEAVRKVVGFNQLHPTAHAVTGQTSAVAKAECLKS
ncbi:MAG: redoxin domain-containing protein [Nitrospirota bacterium]